MLPPKSLIAAELELLCLFKKCQGTTFFHFPSAVTVGCFKSLHECIMENWDRVFPLVSQVHACWGFMLENTIFFKGNVQ